MKELITRVTQWAVLSLKTIKTTLGWILQEENNTAVVFPLLRHGLALYERFFRVDF